LYCDLGVVGIDIVFGSKPPTYNSSSLFVCECEVFANESDKEKTK